MTFSLNINTFRALIPLYIFISRLFKFNLHTATERTRRHMALLMNNEQF